MKNGNRKRKARNISRVGCRARLVVAQVKETGRWYVKDFIDEHNHPLATRELACMLRSHRRIREEQKASIVEMEISGIRKQQIMDILEMRYGRFDMVGCTDRDIYNFSYSYKQETIAAGDAQTMISHLKARQDKDPEFFFKYLVDADGHLNGLFWSDSQSLLDYEAFGDVVIFDSTYRTNRYNMPFVLGRHDAQQLFHCSLLINGFTIDGEGAHQAGEA
jgi:zinc finger SWIM domain-containing protein 3